MGIYHGIYEMDAYHRYVGITQARGWMPAKTAAGQAQQAGREHDNC